jgi:hypothetical protein
MCPAVQAFKYRHISVSINDKTNFSQNFFGRSVLCPQAYKPMKFIATYLPKLTILSRLHTLLPQVSRNTFVWQWYSIPKHVADMWYRATSAYKLVSWTYPRSKEVSEMQLVTFPLRLPTKKEKLSKQARKKPWVLANVMKLEYGQ